jgi:glycosyltransferase involved in cell wall biosynthesis
MAVLTQDPERLDPLHGTLATAAPPEVSVVIPCLNEAETLAACIEKVQRVFRESGITGEIVVADNASIDGSSAIARGMGARVVYVASRGYGSALRSGISAARGRYVITGDADDSHDLMQIPLFLSRLRDGLDLVVGNRFRGGIQSGAMPRLHRYVGNPVLTLIGKLLFHSPCGDQQCGFRGFSREAFLKMGLRATGMEFASEMVIKAASLRMRIGEIPTPQFPARRHRRPHLRTWRDGWRHLRLMLLHSPRWLFLYPGILLMIVGTFTGTWLLPGPRTVWGVTFDIHTFLYAATAVLLGFQSVTFAAFTRVYAVREGLLPKDCRLGRLLRGRSLELGLILGCILVILGLGGSAYAVRSWGVQHFGNLDPTRTMRLIIPAVVSLTLGGQIVLSSFFLSVLLLGSSPEVTEAIQTVR